MVLSKLKLEVDNMQVVILAGGYGTRISEESHDKPKPMIEIGGRPILWHIMKMYSFYGFNDFIICCGYKGDVIKDYFREYTLNNSDFQIDIKSGTATIINTPKEDWNVKLIDTGIDTMTGGRLKRIENYLEQNDFHMTYGDGLSDINLHDLVKHHKKKKVQASVTAIKLPGPGRFGTLEINNKNMVQTFDEKRIEDRGRISGGFFILKKSVLDLIDSDETVWEAEPLSQLASSGELSAFEHNGFWHPMDSLRDKNYLSELWVSNKAPWRSWG